MNAIIPAPTLPETLAGYIWRASGWHQGLVSVLSVAVFLLSAAPLEIQRRIVNDAIQNGLVSAILWLALVYACLALAEGGLKLVLNIYRAWISENAVRQLRRSISVLAGHGYSGSQTAKVEGTEISMILSEVEPIGGFVGISVSEPLLQGGVLVSVFGYLL
jgi:ABC-type multidrug transport system fused ATPase/permease subunit